MSEGIIDWLTMILEFILSCEIMLNVIKNEFTKHSKYENYMTNVRERLRILQY